MAITIAINIRIVMADSRIVVYLTHAPNDLVTDIERENKNVSLETAINQMDELSPTYTSQKMLKSSMRSVFNPPLSGLVAIYGGYVDVSDPDGLISFPLRHGTPKLYVAITPDTKLVMIKGNTFSHREFVADSSVPKQLFSFELKQDDKKIWFWNVQEVQIPADRKINPLTLTILTYPKNIVVPTGDIIATENSQLVLPNLYLVSRSNNEDALLRSIDNRRYLEPITVEQKKAGDTVMQKMITNL